MSQMHQMQLTYVSMEDRLLFRLNTKARQEFRFWMTRRYVMILWHSLNQLLAKEVGIAPVETEKPLHDPLVEATKKEIKHQEMVSQADFTTQYQESTYLPLGETPALLFSVGLKPSPEGQTLLCMHPESGQGIEIASNEQILHSLCQLLIDTTAKADWRLNLAFLPRSGGLGEVKDGKSPQGLN
ncbi:MAG: hypothetical protein KA250_07460 [Verrucomicrobiales bacterium]|jgi:hypothetical protein|nr:hypothetical protein [Verrucomicrobiales bacterium]MBP9223819.1 hypothetical protein [Verrucomicrobiales bacterium]